MKVGSYNDGKITKDELDKIEEYSCPSCGNCAGLFTANTMNCLAEALGMALPRNDAIPAPYGRRRQLAKRSGMQIMELVKQNIRPKGYYDIRCI